MILKGKGYSVGPGYEIECPMVFDIIDHQSELLLLVREDKDWDIDSEKRRRENAVKVTIDDLRSLLSADWLRRRLGLA
ncbi:MAG: hypothetical protein OIN66_03225 [Candidatus Methanoperedens sp.]|nr:hypothetical protein [Candidatus Methanoperedens sp.]